MIIFGIIDLKIFLIALLIGIVMIHLYSPPPQIVYKYPTPYNLEEVTYKDASGTCYKYDMTEIDCPADKKLIKPFQLRMK